MFSESFLEFILLKNFRLDESLIVKVSDFGLSRDVYEKNYYTVENTNRCLPVRWMSIEAIQFSTFTTESDVVSIESLPIRWMSNTVIQLSTFTTESDVVSHIVLIVYFLHDWVKR